MKDVIDYQCDQITIAKSGHTVYYYHCAYLILDAMVHSKFPISLEQYTVLYVKTHKVPPPQTSARYKYSTNWPPQMHVKCHWLLSLNFIDCTWIEHSGRQFSISSYCTLFSLGGQNICSDWSSQYSKKALQDWSSVAASKAFFAAAFVEAVRLWVHFGF